MSDDANATRITYQEVPGATLDEEERKQNAAAEDDELEIDETLFLDKIKGFSLNESRQP